MGCLAFEFSTVFGSLVSTNSFRLKDDNVLEEDEVFKGTYEIPSIIARQLSATAVEPKVTYVVIQDDDSELPSTPCVGCVFPLSKHLHRVFPLGVV